MKKKLGDQSKAELKEFLDKNTAAIINAEIETYREMPISTHTSRMYVFTTLSMGVADIMSFNPEEVDLSLREVVREFKVHEKMKIREIEEAYEAYQKMGGSYVSALVCFMPSKALHVDLKNLEQLPEDLREKAKDKTISPDDILDHEKYKDYHHLVDHVLTVNYTSFYTTRGTVYKMIGHNDEVIDMPVYFQFGENSTIAPEKEEGGLTPILQRLIEIE